MEVTVSEEKANFAKLLKAAESGEIVIVTRNGKSVASIEGLEERASLPRIGAFEGEIWMSEDFDAPLGIFDEYTK